MESRADLLQRLNHSHYISNVLLCLPLPIVLAYHLSIHTINNGLTTNTIAAMMGGPLMMAVTLFKPGQFAEMQVEAACFNLQICNLCSLFWLRSNLNLTIYTSIFYALGWLAVSFFFPQPPYLGQSKLSFISSEEFDEVVAIVPPAIDFLVDNPENHPSPASQNNLYTSKRANSKDYFVVLCHAEWIRKSRELEIVLSRLSWNFTTTNLSFYVLTPSLSSQTFYDLELSMLSNDLPALFLFHKGKIIGRLPRGEAEIKRERRKVKEAKNSKKLKGEIRNRVEESGSESESENESDGERQVEMKVAMERFKWDRSAQSIIDTFKLEELSKSSKKKI